MVAELPPESIRAELGPSLYDLLLAFNRRLTTLLIALGPKMALSESHVLGEICQRQSVHSKWLVDTLYLEKSKVSRIAASFSERGWITIQHSPTDKRIKYFEATATGAAAFEEDNAVRNEQVRQCLAPLTPQELTDFTLFTQRMATMLEAEPVSPFSGDMPAKNEIRRLTRVFGYLGDNLFGIGMSVTDAQILHLIYRDGGTISMAALRDLLPYETSMLSRTISALGDRGLLTKKPLSFDRRHVEVSLTPKGNQRARNNIIQSAPRIFGSMADRPESAIRYLIYLLEKSLCGHGIHGVLDSQSGREVRQPKSEEERRAARGFLVEQLVRENRHFTLGEQIVAEQSVTALLFMDGHLRGLCEIQRYGEHWILAHLTISPEAHSDENELLLFLEAAERCFQGRANSVICTAPAEVLSEKLLRHLTTTEDFGMHFSRETLAMIRSELPLHRNAA